MARICRFNNAGNCRLFWLSTTEMVVIRPHGIGRARASFAEVVSKGKTAGMSHRICDNNTVQNCQCRRK
jgi:hypothetical protein